MFCGFTHICVVSSRFRVMVMVMVMVMVRISAMIRVGIRVRVKVVRWRYGGLGELKFGCTI